MLHPFEASRNAFSLTSCWQRRTSATRSIVLAVNEDLAVAAGVIFIIIWIDELESFRYLCWFGLPFWRTWFGQPFSFRFFMSEISWAVAMVLILLEKVGLSWQNFFCQGKSRVEGHSVHGVHRLRFHLNSCSDAAFSAVVKPGFPRW